MIMPVSEILFFGILTKYFFLTRFKSCFISPNGPNYITHMPPIPVSHEVDIVLMTIICNWQASLENLLFGYAETVRRF